ncbi:RNA polymerase sigma factor [Prevotella sp. OH937_COT-195]|uniref:RNA polymerase sigma factor n=1 Tax=Prevotella sp. OH937_COT-195 TaxID=2491051 RepID=UPI000F6495B5|nr:sigma-70 family RNA polymerase sigma factor [Prevotella sp. OH937_COT-195]RRC99474.1 sigma-70 family RNA polymerase sigma factor [Prevotella sp. OH937_COT-195]
MKTSIELLFRYHYRPLCMYALHYLQDLDKAEDVVQDFFLRLVEKKRKGADIENTKAYLYSATRNSCIDYLRKSGNTAERINPQDVDGDISDEEAVGRSINEAELWTAIDALPPRQREVLLPSKRDGLRYRDIACELDISVKTVENLISRALHTLRGKADNFIYFLFCFS